MGRESSNELFYVMGEKGHTLIGLETAERLGILRINSLSVNSVQTLNQIEMSNKIKDVNIVLSIDKSVRPVQQPYRRIPAPLEKAVKLKLDELRECGIIERVDHSE